MSDLAAIAAAAMPAAIEAGETELAKGLAGLLGQVYGDTLSPGAKQVGTLIEDAVKTVRLLAWPLQMGSVLQDRFRRDLTAAMESVAPPDRQIPPIKLFADCCEGSKFEEDPTLREMWQQLLRRGCDKTRAGEAHPSYPLLIRQLSSDEALLLARADERGPAGILPAMCRYDLLLRVDAELIIQEEDGFPILQFSSQIAAYVNRLTRLGLLELKQIGDRIPLIGDNLIIQKNYKVKEVFILTDEGRNFMKATSAPKSTA